VRNDEKSTNLRRRRKKAAPHNLARADCEENFRQNKAETRRNPLWISRVDNAVLAEIFRKTPKT
jgi:hypothetical protein